MKLACLCLVPFAVWRVDNLKKCAAWFKLALCKKNRTTLLYVKEPVATVRHWQHFVLQEAGGNVVVLMEAATAVDNEPQDLHHHQKPQSWPLLDLNASSTYLPTINGAHVRARVLLQGTDALRQGFGSGTFMFKFGKALFQMQQLRMT